MRKHIASCVASCCLLAAACGPGKTQYTVAGKTLTVAEVNFGKADYFCPPLANGQFMVVLSDAPICDQLHQDAGNKQVFHATDETNLRIMFPSFLKKVPPQNDFAVAQTDCQINPNAAEAAAFFSHNDMATMHYDLNKIADGTKVSVNYNDYNMTAGTLKGHFELDFGSDHVAGDFDALFCNGLLPGIGN